MLNFPHCGINLELAQVCCPCAITVLYKYCPNCLVCFTNIPSWTEKEWKNSLWLFRFYERVTQQKPPWIGGILESSLRGPGWRFHVFVFLLYNSHQSLLPHVPDIGTCPERPPASLAVHQDGSQKGLSFYRKPFVPPSPERPSRSLLGMREGKNWLADWRRSSRGNPPGLFNGKNDWQWVSACLADTGTQRWLSEEGQNGQRHVRMGAINKVTQTVSPSEL